RYVLTIDGLDAALFVQHLELGNLAATGSFDGKLPLVFDKNGGRIEDGYLNSRPPGGNVSYVGELTYEDLSGIANFAFDALRSVDYRQMDIGLSGSLEGEIVTSVTFDGIRQGEGASSNFLTRRLARLPIRFRINVRAPFMQLVTSVRSLYDPGYVRDPRLLGIFDQKEMPAAPLTPQFPSPPQMPPTRPDEPSIQPSESDEMP
ncbi:MAG: YdbH domain-containing protein, partial [Sphingomonadaceae bacterium]|nr:YdbH domain-containing protein [Sphingomonadaceae bacterium]